MAVLPLWHNARDLDPLIDAYDTKPDYAYSRNMADQDTELPTEPPTELSRNSPTRFSASSRSRSPSFGEAIEKLPALSPDETQVESSGSPLGDENPPLGSPHERNLTDDDDSTFEEDAESTTSLTDEYQVRINDRIYTTVFRDVFSWTPTDDYFCELMDNNHFVVTKFFDDNLCQAPVMNKAQRVLDVGTGTGIWAIDFADLNPQAKVIGSDISPIQPEYMPPNLTFELDDFNQSWTWKTSNFDYVHLRNLTGNVHDWPHLFGQAFECLRPKGYLESHEQSFCFSLQDPNLHDKDLKDLIGAIGSWNSIFWEMERRLKRPFIVADNGTQLEAMEKAGFVDLKSCQKPIPIGGWTKDDTLKKIGRALQAALLSDLEGFLTYPAKELGWNHWELTVLLASVRRALQCQKLRVCMTVAVVVGQKPG